MGTAHHSPLARILPALALGLLAGCSGSPGGGTGKGGKDGAAARPGDDALEAARQLFQASADRANIGLALQQVNSYLGQNPAKRAAPLTAEQRALAQKRFGADKGEWEEVESPIFTTLDAAYLEQCFLFRDVVRSLDLDRLSQAERAAAGFDWSMRQLVIPPEANVRPTPPDYVLRRGWGSATDRAYVFLAVLQQLGLPGCLVVPSGGDAPWACGALVEVAGSKEKHLLLFDHRLGLPLPGPKGPPDGDLAKAFRLGLPVAGPKDGTQVATLADLRKQPELLAALKGDDKASYDVTADAVKGSRLEMAVPVSALAPRLRMLQDEVLPPAVAARLALDPEALARALAPAAGGEGSADALAARPEATGLLRRFLPESEGGVDREGAKVEFHRTLIPRGSLPPQVQALEGQPRTFLEAQFALPFIASQVEPRAPRDLHLRGRFQDSSQGLTKVLEEVRIMRSLRQMAPQVEQAFGEWRREITAAFGDMARAASAAEREKAQARIDLIWKQHQKDLMILINGAAAAPRHALATYLQALTMHEQAERAQARLEAAGGAADVESLKRPAAARWKESAGWWESFLLDYPTSLFSPSARLLLARAREATGQTEQARALVEDASGPQSRYDRVARLYLAGRLK